MPNFNTINSKLYALVDVDANYTPTLIRNKYIPPAVGQSLLGGVKADGMTTMIGPDGTITATTGGTIVQTLQGLTDVDISEPTFSDTGNTIVSIAPTTITVSGGVLNLAVGDWIRGNASPNEMTVQITAIAGNVISVASTSGLNFVSLIFKLTNIGIAGKTIVYDLAQNQFVSSPLLTGVKANALTATSGLLALVDGTNTTWVQNANGSYQVNVTGAGTGSVTNVSVASPLSTALTFANSTTTPALTIQNVSVPTTQYLRGDGTWNAPVSSLMVGPSGTARTGALRLVAGTNTTIVDNGDGSFTFNATGGGGGGAFSSVRAIWTTANSATKNAYTAPSVINNDGITVNLVATSGSGSLTAITVTLNGTALTNTYTSTGTFPNYVVTIPVADITGTAVETASTVTVQLTGTFGSSGFNASANNLVNNQPVAYTATSTARYTRASVPFYVTSDTVTITGSDVGSNTGFTLTVNAGATSESVTNFKNYVTTNSFGFIGSDYVGTISGTGTAGAGASTININQSPIVAPTTFICAFYNQTTNSTIPTFTTSSSQTAGDQVGSTITYPVATASTQYNWIATTRPIGSLVLVTALGSNPLTPDVSGTQTISGTTFNVFGWTGLGVGTSSVLQIS